MVKRSFKIVSSLFLGAAFMVSNCRVFTVEAREAVEKRYLGGNDRYETAVRVSEEGWNYSDNVVLVNGTAIADALSAAPFAREKSAPILLTGKDKLTWTTKDRIRELGARKVYIIGGTGVVSNSVVRELENMGISVERIHGLDRYETSIEVAKKLNTNRAFVVNGISGLADALSIAAPAGENNIAIILTNGRDIGRARRTVEGMDITVVGGTGVVSEGLRQQLRAERIYGNNRNETNGEVLKAFYGNKAVKEIYITKDGAYKENELVDALSAGPLVAKNSSPIILAGDRLYYEQERFLKSQEKINKVYEVGGGINYRTVNSILDALEYKTVVDKDEVTSVKAENVKEVIVNFGTKVTRESAEDKDNYSINKNIKIESAVLSEDERTVILNIKEVNDKVLKNQEKYTLEISKVYSQSNREIYGKFDFTPLDNKLPAVENVVSLGTKAVKVIFTEPIKKVSSNNFTLDGNKFYGSVTNNGREVILTTFDRDLLKPGEHKLAVDGAYDYVGLRTIYSETKFWVQEDNTPPTVEKVTATLERVILTFSEDVDPDTMRAESVYYKSGGDKIRANKMNKLAGNKYEYYFSQSGNRLPAYEVMLYVEDVKDYSGNKIKDTNVRVRPEVDTTRPQVKSVTVDSDNKTIVVKFNKILHRDSRDSKFFTVKDRGGKVLGIRDVKWGADDYKVLEVVMYDKLPEGRNSIKIFGIKDGTHLQNVMLDYNEDFVVGDTTAPTILSVASNRADRKIVITFSEVMNSATLNDESNYYVYLDGKMTPLPSSTDITVVQNGRGVMIVLPERIDGKTVYLGDNITEIQVMAVRDLAGNILEGVYKREPIDRDSKARPAERYSEKIREGNAIAEDRRTIKVRFNKSIESAYRDAFKLDVWYNNEDVRISEVYTDGTDIVKIRTNRDMPTDIREDALKITDGYKIKTSAGSSVDESTPIRIVDKISPEVVLESSRGYKIENGNEIIIPFSENLDTKVNPIYLKADLDIFSQYEPNYPLKVTEFEVDFVKDSSGNSNKLKVTINPSESAVSSRYVIKFNKDEDGKVKFIKDLKGNRALAKEATSTDGEIKGTHLVPIITSYKVSSGSSNGTIKIDYNAENSRNNLAYEISNNLLSTPLVGSKKIIDNKDIIAYTSGDNIKVDLAKYVSLYELNSENKIVKFLCFKVEDNCRVPNVTITKASYENGTIQNPKGLLIITGTNFNELGAIGKDIKSQIDWTKLLIRANDGIKEVNHKFNFTTNKNVINHIEEAKIKNETTIKITLTADKTNLLDKDLGVLDERDKIIINSGFLRNEKLVPALGEGEYKLTQNNLFE